MLTWTKPVEGEYLPYQLSYISKVADGDLLEILKQNILLTADFLRSIPADKLDYRYAEGKWTIKQIAQHLIDTERIMGYRVLTFARNDKTELPGFEENDYANECNADARELNDMIIEYTALRNSTILMMNSFTDEFINRSGTANRGRVTVKSLAYVIAGHELHHCGIIRERYL